MIEVVTTAKKMKIYTIVADRDSQSPAKCFADKAIDVSTDQIDILEAICREEKVDGVFTGFEDFNIHIACELCKRLKLPFYANEKQLEIITDKLAFKQRCVKYGIPIVEQHSLYKAISEGKYPYIIKPVDSYGSRGITVCKNVEQLERGYKKALLSSSSRQAIIERFIDSEYGVELFYTVVNGKVRLTVTADRYTSRMGETTVPLPVAEVFPSKHREQLVDVLDDKIQAMLCGMGIENGLVLIRALYKDGEFFVYEMAYRLTGEQHYRLVEKQHGINLAEMMIKLALDESVDEFDTNLLCDTNFIYPSINFAVLLNSGTIKEIKGLEKVFQIDEVISYNLVHKNFDTIHANGDYSHMLIRVNMVGENYFKLCKAVDLVGEYISVTSDRGEEMLTTKFKLSEDV